MSVIEGIVYNPETGLDERRPIGRFVRRVFRNGNTPQTERVLALPAGAGV